MLTFRTAATLALLLPACTVGSNSFLYSYEGSRAGDCSDGEDNDGDGAADCEDTDCAAASFCLGADDSAPTDDTDPPDDTDTDTDPPEDTDTKPDVDCSTIPTGPYTVNVIEGPRASEDLAFDHEGHLIGMDNGNLYRSTYDGEATLILPALGGSYITGIRALPSGDFVYADVDYGALVRVTSAPSAEVILWDLSYPNGIDVDLNGYVYLSEFYAGRVRRIDPMTGEYTIVAENIGMPNGVSFSEDYSQLYIADYGAGRVYAKAIDESGNPGLGTLFASGLGGNTGTLDGIGVDYCGNVFVCEWDASRVWRVSADGWTKEVVIEIPGELVPNLQWGSGVGGWKETALYIPDTDNHRVYEIEIGVPGKVRAYP